MRERISKFMQRRSYRIAVAKDAEAGWAWLSVKPPEPEQARPTLRKRARFAATFAVNSDSANFPHARARRNGRAVNRHTG